MNEVAEEQEVEAERVGGGERGGCCGFSGTAAALRLRVDLALPPTYHYSTYQHYNNVAPRTKGKLPPPLPPSLYTTPNHSFSVCDAARSLSILIIVSSLSPTRRTLSPVTQDISQKNKFNSCNRYASFSERTEPSLISLPFRLNSTRSFPFLSARTHHPTTSNNSSKTNSQQKVITLPENKVTMTTLSCPSPFLPSSPSPSLSPSRGGVSTNPLTPPPRVCVTTVDSSELESLISQNQRSCGSIHKNGRRNSRWMSCMKRLNIRKRLR